MTRSRRLHTSGALHYLVLRGNAGRVLFPQVADFPAFELLVIRQLAACQIELLAFCWLRDAAHFALRVGTAPLGNFVQQVAGSHARRINRRAGVRGHLFRQRYRTAVVADAQLPAVVSHLHWLPVRAGLATDPGGYAWSSHLSYLGVQPLEWVSTGRVLAALEALERREVREEHESRAERADRERPGDPGSPGDLGRSDGGPLEVYRKFMAREIGKYEAAISRAAAPGAAPPIAAWRDDPERELLARLTPMRHRPAADPRALDQLIDMVAARLGVDAEALASGSRRRILSLGRAIVAWRAMRSGTARLGEVARRLGRHPSTLSIGIERYRSRRPELFDGPLVH